MGKQTPSAHEWTENPTKPIERLREIDALFARVGISQHRDVGIGRGFEKGQSTTNDEEGKEKEGERHNRGSRDEEQCSKAIEEESCEHSGTIAPTTNHSPRRKSHQEITAIDHHLDEGRLGFGEVQLVLKKLVEHIEDAMGKSPKEEERGD